MIEQAGEALTGATAAVEGLGAPFQVWVIPALLGLGLAASTGLRTFLPLLMLSLAARFGWFGVELNAGGGCGRGGHGRHAPRRR